MSIRLYFKNSEGKWVYVGSEICAFTSKKPLYTQILAILDGESANKNRLRVGKAFFVALSPRKEKKLLKKAVDFYHPTRGSMDGEKLLEIVAGDVNQYDGHHLQAGFFPSDAEGWEGHPRPEIVFCLDTDTHIRRILTKHMTLE